MSRHSSSGGFFQRRAEGKGQVSGGQDLVLGALVPSVNKGLVSLSLLNFDRIFMTVSAPRIEKMTAMRNTITPNANQYSLNQP